jgi:hypothetical protein
MSNERHICTAEKPYQEGMPGRWEHPDAVEIDEDYGKGGGVADGDFIKYQCPHCKKSFWEELPN